MSVGLGGRKLNAGGCPASRPAARLNAADTAVAGGIGRPNSSAAYAEITSTCKPAGAKRNSISSASCCASSRGPKMRMRFTASLNSPGNWPSVMRDSRATKSGCNARRAPSFSIAPSSARSAATPPPQVICSDTVLSPTASASTPSEFFAAGGCNAASPSAKRTGFNFAAARTCSRVAMCALEMPASRTCFVSVASRQRDSASCNVATSVEKPRSASICNRLAASAAGNGGSSVCAVKTHFSGRPRMQ